MKPIYITDVEQLDNLDKNEKKELKKIVEKYEFRANDYYLNLIDWDDPADPIRRIIIPTKGELVDWGSLDPSNENNYTVMQGVEHKYDSTVLLLVSNVCGGICRYCFRKRIFLGRKGETLQDLDRAIDYIKRHNEISNVLLTGGDPLMLSTNILRNIVKKLRAIDHVQIIRVGSKLPVFNPNRIIEDAELLEIIKKYSTREKKIYIMTDINHPRELTDQAIKAINLLQEAGALLANQTPIIKGVNDKPEVLADLFANLSYIGVPPYYVFQGRPSSGNKAFALSIEKGYKIYESAKSMVSGLAKRAHFVLSHATGKIEILGMDEERIFFKYHRAYNNTNSGRFMSAKQNAEAYWIDDYNIS